MRPSLLTEPAVACPAGLGRKGLTTGQTIAIKLIAPPRASKAEKAESSLLARLGGGSLKDRLSGGAERDARPRRDERPRERPERERGERGDRGARGGRGR